MDTWSLDDEYLMIDSGAGGVSLLNTAAYRAAATAIGNTESGSFPQFENVDYCIFLLYSDDYQASDVFTAGISTSTLN
jgi:hypothetical protein